MVMASHQAFKTHTDPPVNPVKHPLSCTHQPSPSATPRPGRVPEAARLALHHHPPGRPTGQRFIGKRPSDGTTATARHRRVVSCSVQLKVARRCRDWFGVRPRLLIYGGVTSRGASTPRPACRRWFRGQFCSTVGDHRAALLRMTPSNPTLKCCWAARRSISTVIGLISICAATSSGSESGTGTPRRRRTVISFPPRRRRRKNTETRVPTVSGSTPGPASAMTPVASAPTMTGERRRAVRSRRRSGGHRGDGKLRDRDGDLTGAWRRRRIDVDDLQHLDGIAAPLAPRL